MFKLNKLVNKLNILLFKFIMNQLYCNYKYFYQMKYLSMIFYKYIPLYK